MKPLVIVYDVSFYNNENTYYNIVWKWNQKFSSSVATREEAEEVIKEYDLPIDHEDEFGRIYADPADNPYMNYKLSYINTLPADQQRLYRLRRHWILDEMGGAH